MVQELVAPLARTIHRLLSRPRGDTGSGQGQHAMHVEGLQDPSPIALLAFGERSHSGSEHFVSLEEVCNSFFAAGCNTSLLTRERTVRMGEQLSIVVLKVSP